MIEVIELVDPVAINRYERGGVHVGWTVSDDKGNARTYLNCDMETAELRFRAIFAESN